MLKKQILTLKVILSTILIVLSLFFAFIAVMNFNFKINYTTTQVRGFSMLPTINSNMTDPNIDGDTIYIKTNANFSTNDIVVAKVSWFQSYIIKRVVACPGDKIQIKNRITHYDLMVNDKLLYSRELTGTENDGAIKAYYDKYKDFINPIKSPQFINNVSETEAGEKCIIMNENEYFVMGDNWGHTSDCLEYGPISKQEIVGRVDMIVDVENKSFFTQTWFMIKKLFS